MTERVLERHALKGLTAQLPERAAGSRQDQPLNVAGVTAMQTLVNGVVLAVHRQNGGATFPSRLDHQRTGHHEHFLVRERQRLARVNGRERGFEARRAGRGTENQVDVRVRRGRDQPVSSDRENLEIGLPVHARRQFVPRGVGRDTDRPRSKTAHLLGKERRVLARGERDDREPVRMRRDDIERALPDRTGGAEHGDAFHRSGTERGQQIEDRRGEQVAVEPVEHAAVSRNQLRAVLHAGTALEERFEQIPGDADDREDHGDDRAADGRPTRHAPGAERESGEAGGDEPARSRPRPSWPG